MGKVLIITKITKRGGWPALWAQDYNIIIMPKPELIGKKETAPPSG